MAFVISASTGIILFASLFLTKRKLSLFEMIVIWSFLQLLQNQYFWELSLNMKVLRITDNTEKYVAFLFNHLITVPVITFYCLELALSVPGKWLKLAAIVLNSAFCGVLEYLCRVFKIVEEKPGFMSGFAVLFWVGASLLLYIICAGMRRIAAKDVNG